MQTRILVATDGSHGATGAVRLAQQLAARDGLDLDVVTVHPPAIGYGLGPLYPAPPSTRELDEQQAGLTRTRAQQQIDTLSGSEAKWDVHLEIGPPAPGIVRHALEVEASLIVLGLGGHSRADRWLGTETALRVAHLAPVPVWAVPASATELPGRVLVGIDFSEFSLAAARAAARLLPTAGELHLLHVNRAFEIGPGAAATGWARTYTDGALGRMEFLAGRLRGSSTLHVDASVRTGDPAEELLAEAERLQVDVLAVGSHGAGFLTRLLAGSVCTRVLRGATRSVLLVPPPGVPAELRLALAHA